MYVGDTDADAGKSSIPVPVFIDDCAFYNVYQGIGSSFNAF